MKIIFVLPTVNMSGGIRVVAIYAAALSAKGHEVTLISPPPRRPSWWRRLRMGWKSSPQVKQPKSHLDGLSLRHHVLNTWRPVVDRDVPDADVVVATWWETAEWVAALSPSKGAKVYFVQHHEVFSWLPMERCHATYRLPMKQVVIARWLERVMKEQYGSRDVVLVSNSVDHEQFNAPPRAKQARPTVGFLYASAHFKGMDLTLRAIEELRQRHGDLRVIAFGSEPIDPALSHGIEFTFDPPQDRLRELYASCDVWLTASRSEGFNLPAMEAMACRTPVVSTRAGWPEEAVVDGVNGALVQVDDWAALGAAAHQVLSLEDTAWRAMSQGAYDTVKDSSWARSADLFEQALQAAHLANSTTLVDR